MLNWDDAKKNLSTEEIKKKKKARLFTPPKNPERPASACEAQAKEKKEAFGLNVAPQISPVFEKRVAQTAD